MISIRSKIYPDNSLFIVWRPISCPRLKRCSVPQTPFVMVRHLLRNDVLMHIASLDNLSLLLEENVRSAFFGQVGVICARRCQTTSKHSVTFGGLKKDFHLHAKFNLGTKKKKKSHKSSFFLQVSRVHRGHKNKAFKRRPRHKRTLRSIFAVKIFCL